MAQGPDLPRPFFRAEHLLLACLAALAVATALLDLWHPARVDWPAFLVPVLGSLGLIGIGAFIRLRRPMPRMAHFAISLGILMAFSALASVFIFLLFPFRAPMIDGGLMRIDAALGYSWTGFLEGLAGFPLFGRALGWVYLSSLPQLVLVIIVLAAQDRPAALHRFLLVGMATMTGAVAIWWLAPSVGPSAHVEVPVAAAQTIGLVVDAQYGATLARLAQEGMDFITPARIIGVIAFPSFHMVMACMVIWFTRGTPVFPVTLPVNLLMIPATLSHGGHHLIDILAGIALFAACTALAARIVPGR